MSSISNFKEDIRQEQHLGAFLDGLYAQLNIQFERVADKDMQYEGVDIVVHKEGKLFLADEKAQLDYIGTSIPTFAFEIGIYNKRKEHTIGWLFDSKKTTTHYMLITDIYLKNDAEPLSEANIASAKLLWVNRAKLFQFLADNGFGKASCEAAEREAREENKSGKIPTGIKGLYFYLSPHKAEAPFNLVIAREYLLKIGRQILPKEI